jgi:hypothetical protein
VGSFWAVSAEDTEISLLEFPERMGDSRLAASTGGDQGIVVPNGIEGVVLVRKGCNLLAGVASTLE